MPVIIPRPSSLGKQNKIHTADAFEIRSARNQRCVYGARAFISNRNYQILRLANSGRCAYNAAMISLISSCAMAGVAEWVCCPGAMNGPIAHALACCPQIHRWHMQEERAAAFFALGRIQATARAVAVVAGSGSAATALMPAVVEAYYQRRPLIVITVDSPQPVDGTGAWGRIEQDSLFGLFAPTVDLHLPCSVSDLPDMVSLCAEGFPIHLRLICSPGLRRSSDGLMRVANPPAPPRFRGSLVEVSQMLRFRAREEGLLLILGELDPAEQEPALWLARTLRVPILAEPTCGLREKLSTLLLPPTAAHKLLAETPPRYVLRVGSVPSFPFWSELEDMPDTEVYSITRSGFSGLRRSSVVMEGDLDQIVRAMDEVPHVGDVTGLIARARKHAVRLEEELLNHPEGAPALVRAFSHHACLADVMFLGSPSAEQLWSAYAQQQMPVFYTRTVSQAGGSDGVISAFLANAVDASFACALVGDISLLRDMSAGLLLPQLPPGKRVIAVLNNDGAGLADSPGLDAELHRLTVQSPGIDLQELARLWHAEYYLIRCEADLEIIEGLSDDAFALLDISPAE